MSYDSSHIHIFGWHFAMLMPGTLGFQAYRVFLSLAGDLGRQMSGRNSVWLSSPPKWCYVESKTAERITDTVFKPLRTVSSICEIVGN